jgi:hypothetical protein
MSGATANRSRELLVAVWCQPDDLSVHPLVFIDAVRVEICSLVPVAGLPNAALPHEPSALSHKHLERERGCIPSTRQLAKQGSGNS